MSDGGNIIEIIPGISEILDPAPDLTDREVSTFVYASPDEVAKSASGPTVSVGWLKAVLADIADDLPVTFGVPEEGERIRLNIIPFGGVLVDFRAVNLMTVEHMDDFRSRMDEVVK